MALQRSWITPLVAGAFLLSATTGILIFFDLETPLNKAAHEWLGWAMVLAVSLHITLNFAGLKKGLATVKGKILFGLFALILGLSFLPVGGDEKKPFVAPIEHLAAAPLPVLAQVGGMSVDELTTRLAAAGQTVTPATTRLADLTGPDLGQQMRLLSQVLEPAKAP